MGAAPLRPGSRPAYPVASIVTAHLDGSPTLEQAGQSLRDGIAETAIVWRQGYRPRVAACSAAEAAMLVQLLAGFKLLSALENAQGLNFSEWLPRAVQTGMVIGAA